MFHHEIIVQNLSRSKIWEKDTHFVKRREFTKKTSFNTKTSLFRNFYVILYTDTYVTQTVIFSKCLRIAHCSPTVRHENRKICGKYLVNK